MKSRLARTHRDVWRCQWQGGGKTGGRAQARTRCATCTALGEHRARRGHKSLQTIVLQPAAREQRGSTPSRQEGSLQGSATGNQGGWTWLGNGVRVLLYQCLEGWPRHRAEGTIPRFAKSNRRLHLTLRQSRAGVAAPSSWRREEAVGASGWRRARGQTCSDRYPCPTASRAACFGPGRPGGLVLRSRRRRLCAAAGARDAGCAWLSWRPPAPPPREGAAASGRARDRLSPAAAAAAADPAPGPGASQEEETKTGGRRSAACPDAIRSVAGGESPPNPG